MSRRNVLICFDAFGTLFKPRRPAYQQYGDVARSLGMTGFVDEDIDKAFRAAFKNEAKQNPNYGKSTGLGAERWWTNIITNTFSAVTPKGQNLPPELVTRLLHRFSSDEGHAPMPDALSSLHKIRKTSESRAQSIVVGVITNSDDRVPDVLSSFEWNVSPMRYGAKAPSSVLSGEHEIDFTIMSYDAGFEKPDKRIFHAAVETMEILLESKSMSNTASQVVADCEKIYVGDDYDKDIVGAVKAGWKAVLIGNDDSKALPGVLWPSDSNAATLSQLFQGSEAIGLTSLSKLADRF